MKTKYQEALDRLNIINMVNFIGDKELIKHKNNDIKTLQELVDKETPKKVFKESLQDGLCVKCGAYVNFDMLNDKIEHAPKYCSNCGQKLDWSDIDD